MAGVFTLNRNGVTNFGSFRRWRNGIHVTQTEGLPSKDSNKWELPMKFPAALLSWMSRAPVEIVGPVAVIDDAVNVIRVAAAQLVTGWLGRGDDLIVTAAVLDDAGGRVLFVPGTFAGPRSAAELVLAAAAVLDDAGGRVLFVPGTFGGPRSAAEFVLAAAAVLDDAGGRVLFVPGTFAGPRSAAELVIAAAAVLDDAGGVPFAPGAAAATVFSATDEAVANAISLEEALARAIAAPGIAFEPASAAELVLAAAGIVDEPGIAIRPAPGTLWTPADTGSGLILPRAFIDQQEQLQPLVRFMTIALSMYADVIPGVPFVFDTPAAWPFVAFFFGDQDVAIHAPDEIPPAEPTTISAELEVGGVPQPFDVPPSMRVYHLTPAGVQVTDLAFAPMTQYGANPSYFRVWTPAPTDSGTFMIEVVGVYLAQQREQTRAVSVRSRFGPIGLAVSNVFVDRM